jgi:hypothetical protein
MMTDAEMMIEIAAREIDQILEIEALQDVVRAQDRDRVSATIRAGPNLDLPLLPRQPPLDHHLLQHLLEIASVVEAEVLHAAMKSVVDENKSHFRRVPLRPPMDKHIFVNSNFCFVSDVRSPIIKRYQNHL